MALPSVQSFANTQAAFNYLSGIYGAGNFRNWQICPKDWWSLQPYPEAGASQLNFFGTTFGTSGQNLMLTNLGTQSNFGTSHFLVKSINVSLFVKTWAVNTFAGLNVDTLYSDLINGFVWAGVLDVDAGTKKIAQITKPLLYAAAGRGETVVRASGNSSFVLTEGVPNVLATVVGPPPYARVANKRKSNYLVDPNVFIPAGQTFTAQLSFPSGLIPVIGTGVTDDTTNPLLICVTLSGLQFRQV